MVEQGLIETDDNRAPRGARTATVRTPDGVMLRAAYWPAQAEPCVGTVAVLQGRAECLEKYFETIAALLARGFAVATFDWRGQGGSDRLLPDSRKGHIDDMALYQIDLDAFVAQTLAPHCPKPWFGLAHSMGASVLIAAARSGAPFARLVLSAPMIDIVEARPARLVRIVIETLDFLGFGAWYAPGRGPQSRMCAPLADNPLTADPIRYARNRRLAETAPHLILGEPTIGWLDAAFRQIAAFADPDYPRGVRAPALGFGAGDDRIVSTPAAARFMARMKAGRLIVLPGARHEILQERDEIRALFWEAFDAFVPGTTPQDDVRAPTGPTTAAPAGRRAMRDRWRERRRPRASTEGGR